MGRGLAGRHAHTNVGHNHHLPFVKRSRLALDPLLYGGFSDFTSTRSSRERIGLGQPAEAHRAPRHRQGPLPGLRPLMCFLAHEHVQAQVECVANSVHVHPFEVLHSTRGPFGISGLRRAVRTYGSPMRTRIALHEEKTKSSRSASNAARRPLHCCTNDCRVGAVRGSIARSGMRHMRVPPHQQHESIIPQHVFITGDRTMNIRNTIPPQASYRQQRNKSL